MQIRVNLLILITSLLLPLIAEAKDGSPREIKAETIRYLQDLRELNVKRLREIDETLEQKIEVAKPADIEKDVRALRTTRQEHMLRQEFLDRLIFQVDTKFAGGDLRAFLERALTDMAKVDAVTSSVDTGMWKFLKFAADAVRRLPEQKENIVTFLEGYMNRSISNPIRPEEYLNSRNYTNGAASEAGSPVDREDVGALADRRIKETQADEQDEVKPSAAQAPGYESAPFENGSKAQ
jgi:hypothetical protein